MNQIINVRECPEWLDRAADYFSSRWNIDRQLYVDSMTDSLSTEKSVPRWYLDTSTQADTVEEYIDGWIAESFKYADNNF